MLSSLIHRPFHLSQVQMKWDRSFLLTAAAQPCVLPVESLDPPISPPFNCLGGKQRNFDFIITLGLLCSTVGNLNGILISGDNGLGQGRGRTFYLRLEQKAAWILSWKLNGEKDSNKLSIKLLLWLAAKATVEVGMLLTRDASGTQWCL